MAFLRKHWYTALVVLAAFGLDQATKLAVIKNLELGESWPEEGFFRATHVANSGSAFGLINDQNFGLIIVAFVGVGILAYFYRSQPDPGIVLRTSIALMFAGALGNLTDRLVNGHVTDFIDIGPWWIFNLADSSIVSGVAILAASVLLKKNDAAPSSESEGSPEAVGAEPGDSDDKPLD